MTIYYDSNDNSDGKAWSSGSAGTALGTFDSRWNVLDTWSFSGVLLDGTGGVYSSGGNQVGVVTCTPMSANYQVECDLIAMTAVGGLVDPMIHCDVATGGYLRGGYYDGNSGFYLEAGGTPAQAFTLVAGHTYHLRLRAEGDPRTLSLLVTDTTSGGTIVADLSSTSLGGHANIGLPGLSFQVTNGTASTGLHVANYVVSDIPTAPTGDITADPNLIERDTNTTPIALVGTNTTWNGSTVFSVTGGAVLAADVTDATHATIYFIPPKTGTTVTLGDGAASVEIALAAPVVTDVVVCAGNSLTYGAGTDSSGSYPYQLKSALGPRWSVQNSGIASQSGTTMIEDYDTQISAYYDAMKTNNIAVIWEITNDLYFNASSATAYDNIVTLCNNARNTGFKVVVLTCLPRAEFTTCTIPGTTGQKSQTFETRRLAVNTLIRDNWATFADAIVDVAAEDRLTPPGNGANSTYYADGVHLKSSGYSLVASQVAAGIVSSIFRPQGGTSSPTYFTF